MKIGWQKLSGLLFLVHMYMVPRTVKARR